MKLFEVVLEHLDKFPLFKENVCGDAVAFFKFKLCGK